ncbi:MAG: hypothetical protein RL139_1193 [Gemmatimonadota bacterium]
MSERAVYSPVCVLCAAPLMRVVGPPLADAPAVARWRAAWAKEGPGHRHQCRECDAETTHEAGGAGPIGLRERDVSRPIVDGAVLGPSGRLRLSGRFLADAELVVGVPRQAASPFDRASPLEERLRGPAGSTLDLGDLPSSVPYVAVRAVGPHGARGCWVLRPVLDSRWTRAIATNGGHWFDLEEHLDAALPRLVDPGPRPGPERRPLLAVEVGGRRIEVRADADDQDADFQPDEVRSVLTEPRQAPVGRKDVRRLTSGEAHARRLAWRNR